LVEEVAEHLDEITLIDEPCRDDAGQCQLFARIRVRVRTVVVTVVGVRVSSGLFRRSFVTIGGGLFGGCFRRSVGVGGRWRCARDW
jgi:hypothetical protein